jgi:Leucine Rich Repeat (LRR) protein
VRMVPVLILAVLGYGHTTFQQRSANASPAERQVLMQFFDATGGDRWTKKDGWGTATPVCDWYGVSCEFVDGDPNRPIVTSLDLPHNNLEGQLPPTLADLPGLRSLDVTANRLSGSVPEQILQRWDNHRFEFSGEGNTFSGFVMRTSVEYSVSGVLCGDQDEVRFRFDVDGVNGRARFQSVRCLEAKSRTTYCLVREGTPGSLGRFSRALNALGFANFQAKYDYPFSVATHGLYLTTAAKWSDRPQVSVQTYNRQGPRDVWMSQQLFLGLLAEVSWDRQFRKPKCDFSN